MLRTFSVVLALLLLSLPARAAEEWGIDHEKKARIEAKVVDILCELSGDCPKNCGGGKQQLGLLRDDGKLVLAIKNFDPFAGAVVDLIDFCNRRITADGLYIANPKLPMFVLQFKRLAPDGKWSRANWFVKRWAEAHGAKNKGKWFRHDPAITRAIAEDGVFGIPGLKPPKDD